MEGCCYRLREVARCCRIQADEACERLIELLLEAALLVALGWTGLSKSIGTASTDSPAPSGLLC